MRKACVAALILAGAVAACSQTAPKPVPGAAPTATPSATAQPVAGWYSHGRLQPCASPAMPVEDAAELDRRIRAAGMSPDDPVYVRVEAATTDGGLRIERIVQIGSPTPVKDCPMSGTTIAR